MQKWYQASVVFYKEDSKGRTQKITEVYLLSAISYTDAEARVHEIVPKNNPDFLLNQLTKANYHEVFNIPEGSETWYKVKVCFVSFDEKAQKEKLIPFLLLVNAENPLDAYHLIAEKMGSVQDYQITELKKTNILEVYFPEQTEEQLA